MAGKLTINAVQLGDSSTASQNFVLQTNADGTAKLSRGNLGATSQDIFTVDAAGQVALVANTANKLVNAAGNAPVYGVRAWARFDGTLAGTNAPTAGGNVASVTRTGVGAYTVNFTTPMPTANYCLTVTNDRGASALWNVTAPTTGACAVQSFNPSTFANVDSAFMSFSVTC